MDHVRQKVNRVTLQKRNKETSTKLNGGVIVRHRSENVGHDHVKEKCIPCKVISDHVHQINQEASKPQNRVARAS